MAFVHCQFVLVGFKPSIISEVEYSCSVAVDVSIQADLKDDVAILATVRTKKQQPEVTSQKVA